MHVPNKKQVKTNKVKLLCFDKNDPILLPIGIIALSAPRVNKDIPKTNNNVPTIKEENILLFNGARVKCKTITSKNTGKIDKNDSFIFVNNSLYITITTPL